MRCDWEVAREVLLGIEDCVLNERPHGIVWNVC